MLVKWTLQAPACPLPSHLTGSLFHWQHGESWLSSPQFKGLLLSPQPPHTALGMDPRFPHTAMVHQALAKHTWAGTGCCQGHPSGPTPAQVSIIKPFNLTVNLSSPVPCGHNLGWSGLAMQGHCVCYPPENMASGCALPVAACCSSGKEAEHMLISHTGQ